MGGTEWLDGKCIGALIIATTTGFSSDIPQTAFHCLRVLGMCIGIGETGSERGSNHGLSIYESNPEKTI